MGVKLTSGKWKYTSSMWLLTTPKLFVWTTFHSLKLAGEKLSVFSQTKADGLYDGFEFDQKMGQARSKVTYTVALIKTEIGGKQCGWFGTL